MSTPGRIGVRIVLSLVLIACQLCAGELFTTAIRSNSEGRLSCLLKFVRWPSDTRPGPFIVGIAGSDSDEVLLREVLEGQRLLGRPVQFRAVHRIDEMRRCHLLYLGRTLGPRMREILPQLAGSGVLTVAAIPGFGAMGGMVELSGKESLGSSKGIVLNAEAGRRSGFSFGAGLLAVVDIARTQGSGD
jgi:hypothetical protein